MNRSALNTSKIAISLTDVGIEDVFCLIGSVRYEPVDHVCAQEFVLCGLLWNESLRPRHEHGAKITREIVEALPSVVLLSDICGNRLEPMRRIWCEQLLTEKFKFNDIVLTY